jgi:thiol-disulfide isomerase/thioredoxin
MARIDWESRAARLAALVALVGGALLLLWRAGILLPPAEETVRLSDGSGATVQVRSADVSLETPPFGGLPVGLEIGRVAPDFEFSNLEGRRVRLSDYRGRAVFLNFWATWCGPCRIEMPEIEATLTKYESQGLAVIALNNGETYGPASRFIRDLGLRFTEVGLDPSADVVGRYRIVSMPTSVFIDANGVITRVHLGIATAAQMERFVQEALAGVPAGGG